MAIALTNFLLAEEKIAGEKMSQGKNDIGKKMRNEKIALNQIPLPFFQKVKIKPLHSSVL